MCCVCYQPDSANPRPLSQAFGYSADQMDIMASSPQNKSASKSQSSSEELVDKFLDAIWMERGLSANTLGAYRADLMTLWRGLSERNIPIQDAEKADLLEFIAKRVESGAKPRSTARQLSSFRRFFKVLSMMSPLRALSTFGYVTQVTLC